MIGRMTLVASLAALPGGAANVSNGADAPHARTALVVVNRDTIWSTHLDDLLVPLHRKMDQKERNTFEYRKLLDKLVHDRLLVQEALNIGLDREQRIQDFLTNYRQKASLREFVKRNFDSDIEIPRRKIDSAFAWYYRKLQLRTIAIPGLDSARMVLGRLKAGADADSTARALSMDSRRHNGGLHKLKFYADIPIVYREAADTLPLQTWAHPIPYREVHTLLRVEKREPARDQDLPRVEAKITLMLRDLERQAKWERFLDSLEGVFGLTVDSSAIRAVRADSGTVLTKGFTQGPGKKVFAFDSSRYIDDTALRTRISHYLMEAGHQDFDTLMQNALSALRAELLLNAAAASKGFASHPAVVAGGRRRRDSCLIEAYLNEFVVAHIRFNREEFQEYFDEHREDFREPDEIDFHRVDFSSADTAGTFYQRLEEGADFSFALEQFRPEAPLRKGPPKWTRLTAFPDSIGAELDSLEPGQVTRPYRTTEGWSIFFLKGRRAGKIPPLPEVEMRIREIMFQKKFSSLLDDVLDKLKKSSNIKYFKDRIDAYFKEA